MIKIFFFLLACVVAASYAARTSRIHHGRRVTQSEVESSLSFVVGLLMVDRSTRRASTCTGSLIAPNTVVTAAHCLCGARLSIRVYYKTTTQAQGRSVKVVRFQRATGFRCGNNRISQSHLDVGKVTLGKALPGVRTIPLECRLPAVGREQVGMIGFGLDENGNSGVLKIGFRRTRQCGSPVTNTICVDARVKGIDRTDRGDSGGPMVVRQGSGYALIGTVSGRFMTGRDDMYTFFPIQSA